MQRALVADVDQGPVVALQGLEADGVCAIDFTGGLALILSNRRGVGLVHSSGVFGFQGDIDDVQEEFNLATGQPGHLTIGYHLQARREQLCEQARRMSAAAFATEHLCAPPPTGADEGVEKAKVIDAVLARQQNLAESLAEDHGAACLLMPRPFLAISTDATVHLFKGPLDGLKFQPVA